MTWVSYAQNYEDVVLARVLADVAHGSYVDVGAQDPRMDSVTCAFYERGWRGINIEPVAHWHALLAQARPEDANACVAAGAAEGTLRLFDVTDTGLSTASAEFAARHRTAGLAVVEREVPVRTLDVICAEAGIGEAHFLKIDVEGFEAEVLRGISLDRLRPWVVLVEATEPNSRVSRHLEWESLLLDRGYRFAYGDGINRYYLADEHAGLAPRFGPPTVLDDFVRREQVDLGADIEARLADLDALSHRRAVEIHALAARIADKDAELGDWHARWTAQAESAGQLRGELGHAADRERALREQADAAALRESDLRVELDRMHREAAALQAALAEAASHARVQAAELASRELLRDRMERDLARVSRMVPDLQAALRASSEAHAVAHRELVRHVGLIDELRAERARVLASWSWRLTAPLRGINARLGAVVARVRHRLAGSLPGATPTPPVPLPPSPPLPLSEDAERILALAPVLGAHDASPQD